MDITTDTQVVKPIPTSRGMTLNEAAQANLETGVLLLCKEALVTAIQDRRLERGHLRVLAAVTMFMSSRTGKAWPGRAAIADIVGMSVRAISNTLLELRKFGYLIADREAVEEANHRRLTVYTFGNIDHDTIRSEITAFVQRVRSCRTADELRDEHGKAITTTYETMMRKVTAHGDDQSHRPRGQSPPTVTNNVTAHGDYRPEVTAHGARKSPPAGDSNSLKNSRGVEGECALCNSDTPHLCSDGFSINRRHELFIPMQAIDAWRKRFSKIPDLEAKIEKLSALILTKGHMYPGWQQPGAWMAGCLSDDNKRALDDERLTNAKLAKASAVDPARKNWATAKR